MGSPPLFLVDRRCREFPLSTLADAPAKPLPDAASMFAMGRNRTFGPPCTAPRVSEGSTGMAAIWSINEIETVSDGFAAREIQLGVLYHDVL